ncbi:MAG TPA: glycoside hydrolase family 5 protein [Verrucomicrobiae bacterium]|nr:glycoside hydrolase family 5 protein [Verrucomicrobiae bacterium]
MKTASMAGMALLAQASLAPALAQDTKPVPKKYYGVNLGGWLVLERWITPTLYDGVDAEDEYTFCQKLGKEKATARLQKHRETWITADDFKWLAARGINSVRLPVGYAVLEENAPYISARDTLEWAFKTAKENGLSVLLDLHGVPGSQNGWDHSGRSGEIGWPKSQENYDHSLRIIEGLAEFCMGHDNLLGIELVNEPKKEVPLDFLQKYYRAAYAIVRKHIPEGQGSVVIHDGFRQTVWGDTLVEPDYKNVILDTHMYQCFGDEDKKRDIEEQVDFAVVHRKTQLDAMREKHRCIVGEWSCGLPPHTTRAMKGLTQDAGMRAYAAAQLLSYDTTDGWYFWTYRTEASGGWNFRNCVERGWMPEKYNV